MRTYQSPPGVRSQALAVLGGLALLAICALPAVAQQRRYLVELGAAGSYQSFDKVTELDGATGGVLRIGVWLPANFSLEGEGSIHSSKASIGGTDVSVKTATVSALYNILLGTASTFYLKAGAGGTKYGSDCPGRDQPAPTFPCGGSGALVFGAGARAAVSPTVMIRGEGLLNRNSSSSRSFSNFGVNLGVSLMLGSKPIADSDGDGVLDNRDRCGDTPAGAQVDGRGCTADSDNDGIPNGVDRCPTTVPGATVDANGCTRDSDGDNIPDGLDRCPETQSGVLVDPRGCPRDSDGDAIPDGLDRCSETPSGATVDALGCPGDEDGDGVLDGLDRCPRTATGARVNNVGCAAGQEPGRAAPTGPPAPAPSPEPAARQPAQRPATPEPAVPQPGPARTATPGDTARASQGAPGRFAAGTLRGVEFAPGTARLSPGSYVALDSLVRILLADPSLRIEVGAHTDNAGSAAANLHLTNLQAEAVRNYLVTKGVPFQQVVPRGFGATVPLTPDTTPRGRAANRRIEVRAVAGP
jgi:outer membrane protein OmpA-like peptidoglycan-associated protein